jgi:serine phosphatase RsbU (regulator of sigma subunit)
MKMNIRVKLIVAISTLVVVLFSIASFLFIKEKKVELADDIYFKTLSFARLTAPLIANDYELYLEQNSFVYFNRNVAEFFQQNEDLGRLVVVSYSGDKLYDSEIDVEKQYFGDPRILNDQSIVEKIKSENIYVSAVDEKAFVKITLDGEIIYLDENELEVEPLSKGAIIEYILIPGSEKYSLIFTVDYSNMNVRLKRLQSRIEYLALFGVMLGMIMSFVMSKQITKPIKSLVAGVERIAVGDFSVRVDINTNDEIKVLGDAFNKMATDLESSIEAKIYQERVVAELELATKIQEQILPKEGPVSEGMDISASVDSAGEIGGDIYDFITLADGRLMFYLGDVTGHGVPAGIISSISSALFYGFASEPDLTKILTDVNRVLKAKTMPTMFLTLCLMEWIPATETFNYSSAGHEQIVHYIAAEDRVELKNAGGIALGMLPDVSAHLKLEEVELAVGDFLVVYSDGIPEAWCDKDECYGMERLMAVVKNSAKLGNADAIRKAILSDVTVFRNNFEQMDDITLMIVKKT